MLNVSVRRSGSQHLFFFLRVGLTASLGIGRYLTQLLEPMLGRPSALPNIQTTPLPCLSQLVQDYHQRQDGTVQIDGTCYRVTHPLTRFGWEARTGLASL
jgi:glycerol-3-phosphate dehydrogenase